MYFQPDPILRMIEMLGDFFRRLFSLSEEELAADGLRRIDEAMRRWAGMPISLARAMDAQELVSITGSGSRALAVAQLLEAAAEVLDRIGEEDAAAQDEDAALALWLALGMSASPACGRDRVFAAVRRLEQRGASAAQEDLAAFYAIYDGGSLER